MNTAFVAMDSNVTSSTTTTADPASEAIMASTVDTTLNSSKATTAWTTAADDLALHVDFDALNESMTLALLPTITYISVLMLVGLVGNTVVFLVYYRRFKPSATRSYVMAMSVFDLLANCLSLPSEVLDIRFSFTFDVPWLCKTVRFGNSFLTIVSAFILVAVARDRFRKICHPLDKQRSMLRIKVYILLCCGGSLALTVPFAVLNGSHTVPTGIGNVTGVTCSVDDVYVDTLFPMIYNLVMAIVFIGCVVVMAVSYTRIARELLRHKKNIASDPDSLRRAAAAARGKGTKGRYVAEDTSSGPKHDTESSEVKTSSTRVEIVPVTNLGRRGPATQTSTKAAPVDVSDKNAVLLSVKKFSFDGPPKPSLVEDFDEGCFSASSVEVATSFDNEFKEETTLTDCCACSEEAGLVKNEGTPHGDRVHPEGCTTEDGRTDTATAVGGLERCIKSGEPSTGAREVSEQDVEEFKGCEASIALKTALVENVKEKDTDVFPQKETSCESENLNSTDSSTLQQQKAGKSLSLLQAVVTKSRGRHYNISIGRKPSELKAQKKRRGAGVKKIPSSTTFMMFILTAIFVINYLPHLIIISLRAVSDDVDKDLKGWVLNAYNIGLRSYFMNCAVNCLVYGFCSARFRQECRSLCACRR